MWHSRRRAACAAHRGRSKQRCAGRCRADSVDLVERFSGVLSARTWAAKHEAPARPAAWLATARRWDAPQPARRAAITGEGRARALRKGVETIWLEPFLRLRPASGRPLRDLRRMGKWCCPGAAGECGRAAQRDAPRVARRATATAARQCRCGLQMRACSGARSCIRPLTGALDAAFGAAFGRAPACQPPAPRRERNDAPRCAAGTAARRAHPSQQAAPPMPPMPPHPMRRWAPPATTHSRPRGLPPGRRRRRRRACPRAHRPGARGGPCRPACCGACA